MRQAIGNSIEDDIETADVAFSSNQYQFNDKENAVIEGWTARLDHNNFTKAQRMMFTWSYLQDVVDSTKINSKGSLRLNNAFPPVDPVDPRNSLFDADMMTEYFGVWNQTNKDNDFISPGYDIGIVPELENIEPLRKTTSYLKDEWFRRGCKI